MILSDFDFKKIGFVFKMFIYEVLFHETGYKFLKYILNFVFLA